MMNLKLKTTLLLLKLIIESVMILLVLLAIIWVVVAYPLIIGFITLGALIIFAIVDGWLCIYYDLKENDK